MSKLLPGQLAPDFELPDQNGKPVRLSQFRGRRAVVIFFYPKDDTTGCTVQACGFRDHISEFETHGAEVIGISSDGSDSHRQFRAKYSLPFTLLTDATGTVRKLYGASGMLGGLIPGRVTYVIDRSGILRHVFSSHTKFLRHVDEALGALEQG